MTIDEWADRYRLIAPEFSAEPGQWNTKRVPYLRAVMRACSPSHPCQRVVLVKPAQCGGSEAAILNTLGYLIDLNPRSVLAIFPTIELAQSSSRERLEPMIAMMPRLRDKVCDVAVGPDTANRSSIKKKRYPGGFLNFGGANSAAGLSSRPVPVVLMDEVDSCVKNAGSSGDPTRLLTARTSAFVDKKEIFLSSPSNNEDETGILQLWHDSNQGVLETQCPNPECGTWQVLEWERMDLESVKVACVKCGEHFGQHEWNRGEEFMRWRFDRPEHDSTSGFRLNGLNSPGSTGESTWLLNIKRPNASRRWATRACFACFSTPAWRDPTGSWANSSTSISTTIAAKCTPVTSPERRYPMASCF